MDFSPIETKSGRLSFLKYLIINNYLFLILVFIAFITLSVIFDSFAATIVLSVIFIIMVIEILNSWKKLKKRIK